MAQTRRENVDQDAVHKERYRNARPVGNAERRERALRLESQQRTGANEHHDERQNAGLPCFP